MKSNRESELHAFLTTLMKLGLISKPSYFWDPYANGGVGGEYTIWQ